MSQSPVTIESTTDSEDAVKAALGVKVEKEPDKEPGKSATDDKPSVETASASEADDEIEDEIEDDEPAKEASSDKPKKKKGGFKKRIDRLNRKISETEERAKYWENEAIKLRDSGKKQVEPEKKADTSKKPKADDFEKHEDFVEALADWKAEEKWKEREAKQRESEVKAEVQKRQDSHQKRLDEFKKSHSDFDDVIEEANDIPVSMTIRDAILSSENGPELMYALAKDPEELKRIAALPPLEATRALGRFESKITQSSSDVKTEPKTTKAPAPMREVGSRAGNPKTIRDDLPYEEWVAIRRAGLPKGA